MLGFEAIGRLALGELAEPLQSLAPGLYTDSDGFPAAIVTQPANVTLLPPFMFKQTYLAVVTQA